MHERGERHFGQLLREDVGRVVSGLENFARKSVSVIANTPLESALLTITTGLALYTFGFADFSELARSQVAEVMPKVFGPMPIPVMLGLLIPIPYLAYACVAQGRS